MKTYNVELTEGELMAIKKSLLNTNGGASHDTAWGKIYSTLANIELQKQSKGKDGIE